MIWRWLWGEDEEPSRTAAIKELLLREATELLVPREGQTRPRVIHPTATGEKYSEWELRSHRVQARLRKGVRRG